MQDDILKSSRLVSILACKQGDSTETSEEVSIGHASSEDYLTDLIKRTLEKEFAEQIEEANPLRSERKQERYEAVNVIQAIVEGQVIDSMKKFGMCTCERCIADTTALALTNLPAKYMVIEREKSVPIINHYAMKLADQITVELTKSCMVVQEFPRHKKVK